MRLMATEHTEHYLSARRQWQGNSRRDECVWVDAQGCVKAVLPLPARGHSFALDAPRRRAVVFGRQPGFFALAFELPQDSAAMNVVLQAQPLPLPAGHHFYGHGVYAPDGHTLYATENDYVHVRGLIGIYDVRPGHVCTRVGEFDSGGIGPHEIVLMPDGLTLCVANGGLQTHPDFGKTILNAATMQSSLVYLNRHTGQVVQQHDVPISRLSLRHVAVDGVGVVWAGCQYVNADGQRPELVWRHGQNGMAQPLQAVPCPADAQRALRNYVGSITVNRRGNVVAVSSPVGGQVLFWDVGSQTTLPRLLDRFELPDVCGLASWAQDGFALSSGHGVLMRYAPGSGMDAYPMHFPPSLFAVAWDNHLRRI